MEEIFNYRMHGLANGDLFFVNRFNMCLIEFHRVTLSYKYKTDEYNLYYPDSVGQYNNELSRLLAESEKAYKKLLDAKAALEEFYRSGANNSFEVLHVREYKRFGKLFGLSCINYY